MTGYIADAGNPLSRMTLAMFADLGYAVDVDQADDYSGTIPIQARLHYQHARVLREGDLADKMRALELFWESSVYSQTAVMLARN